LKKISVDAGLCWKNIIDVVCMYGGYVSQTVNFAKNPIS